MYMSSGILYHPTLLIGLYQIRRDKHTATHVWSDRSKQRIHKEQTAKAESHKQKQKGKHERKKQLRTHVCFFLSLAVFIIFALISPVLLHILSVFVIRQLIKEVLGHCLLQRILLILASLLQDLRDPFLAPPFKHDLKQCLEVVVEGGSGWQGDPGPP